MARIIKYTTDLTNEVQAQCGEQSDDCQGWATMHVCFEDGLGQYVCDSCFRRLVNEGEWITDSAEVLIAS